MNLFKRKSKTAMGKQVVDVELSKIIEKQSLVFYNRHVEQTTQKLSVLKFKEMPLGTNISQFLGEMTMNFQSLIDTIDQRCNGTLQRTRGKASIDNHNQEEEALNNEIQQAGNTLNVAKSSFNDKGKQYKAEVKMWQMIRLFIVFISLSEFAGNYNVFASIGGNIISNIALSLLAATIIYFYSHFTPFLVAKYSKGNLKKEVFFYTLYLLPIIIVFYGFSLLRLSYLQQLSSKNLFNNNPWIIVAINALAYVISYWLVKKYKVPKDKVLAYKKYKDDLKAIAQLEAQRKVLIRKREAIAPELRAELGDRYSIMLLGKMLENEVESKYRTCFNAFKVELFVKTSGVCAPLFTGNLEIDLPPLKYNYQNINENYNAS